MAEQTNVRRPIDLESVHRALQTPLGMIDDENRRAGLQRFLDAARVFQERAVFDVLSEVATTVNDASPGSRVVLEYEAGRLYLQVVDKEPGLTPDAAMPDLESGELDKVTLRLPGALKQLMDQSATAEGISLNSWCIRALARSAAHSFRHRARGGFAGGAGAEDVAIRIRSRRRRRDID